METVRLKFDDARLQGMLDEYMAEWNLNRSNYTAPLIWIGRVDSETLLAAVGYTPTPDKRVVYISDLLCQKSYRGKRAVLQLVDMLAQAFLKNNVQAVLANAPARNTISQHLMERLGMKPITISYAWVREQ
jgi:RimJ/RimL family protein N-acetyltransferase